MHVIHALDDLARAGLAREATVLRALNAASCPAVPQLLAADDVSAASTPTLPGAKAARAQPRAVSFLVLAPRGAPLCTLAAATSSDEERLVLARRVVVDVLRALGGAHAAGFVHGDVRPSNVVLDTAAGGGARLVDWGAARGLGESGASRWGTLPFVADKVALCFTVELDEEVEPATWTAEPATDLEAVAYLFAAVVLCGEAACAPGWHDPLRATRRLSPPLPPAATPADMVAARHQFLDDHAAQLGEPLFEFLRRVRAGETPYDFEF